MERRNLGGHSLPTRKRMKTLASTIEGTAKTILVLNDDCLLEVFKNLVLWDLCAAADTCQRFRQNAKACFEYSKKTNLSFPKDIQSRRNTFNQLMLRKSGALRNFGEFIISFNDEGTSSFKRFRPDQRVKYHRQTYELLLQYGNKNLINLKLSLFILTEEMRPLLEPLQKLDMGIVKCSASMWDMLPMWCPNLRELTIYRIIGMHDSRFHFGGFKKPFHKLVKITLDKLSNFGNKEIEETLKSNPQLKEIDLVCCWDMDDRFLESLAEHLPGIEKLKFYFTKEQSVDQLNTKYFASFRNLHSLTLQLVDIYPGYAISIINELDTARIPLKYLDITFLEVEPNDAERFADGVSKLLHLETLRLVSVEGVELYHVKNICKHLKQLSQLDLLTDFSMTVADIFELVRDSQNLQSLHIRIQREGAIEMRQLNFCIDTFQQLVRIVEERGVKSHLVIHLIGPAFAGNIPEKVANQYRELSSVKFVADWLGFVWRDDYYLLKEIKSIICQ